MFKFSKIRWIFFKTLSVVCFVWSSSSAILIFCLLLYYMYGGILPFLLIIVAIAGVLYNAEDKLLYHPNLPTHSRVFVPVPSMYTLPYESMFLQTADGIRLHAFFIKQKISTHCPTLLYLHGNAGNMGHTLPNVLDLYKHLECNILLLEWRGYGLSGGVPSERGLYMDAACALDYLYSRREINTDQIIVFGRSLGGAVAIELASRLQYADRIWCLIIENTFTSIPDMARVFLRWKLLDYLPLFCYKNKFLSLEKMKHIYTPTLFISGLQDTLVPPGMVRALYTRCGARDKRLVTLRTGAHNDCWQLPGYYAHLRNYVLLLLHKSSTSSSSSGASSNQEQPAATPSSSTDSTCVLIPDEQSDALVEHHNPDVVLEETQQQRTSTRILHV